MCDDGRVLIKGAGDLATGVAVGPCHAGFRVVMTEREQPLAIRRTVAFSEAVYDGETAVEELRTRAVRHWGIRSACPYPVRDLFADCDPVTSFCRDARGRCARLDQGKSIPVQVVRA